MNPTRKDWLLYATLAAVSLVIWWRLSYPQLAFTDFRVNRTKALEVAQRYLKEEQKVDVSRYHVAVVFHTDEDANRFLQRTVGFDGLNKFTEEHDFDIFYWVVRFFREGEKEEHFVYVSSADAEIIAYRHELDDTYAIKPIDREKARQDAVAFLHQRFGFNPEDYSVKADLKRIFDYRDDFSFSWRKKSVAIAWSEDPDAGYGRLVTRARISGDQVLNFSKASFEPPELFDREIKRLRNTGDNLSTFIRIFYFLLFFASIYFVAARHNHLAMHTTKRLYIGIAFVSFVLSLLTSFNQYESILFDYKTTSPLADFIFRISVDTVLHGIMVSVIVLMPSLSGELLNFEVFAQKKVGTFLHYVRSSFFTRSAAKLVVLGYLVCAILLGLQALMIAIGQRYWGVWREYSWITQLTSAYVPLLAGFTIAYKASFTEELMYRMFAISLGKKLFKSTVLAVILSSLIWGFAHSGYTVFPMWFRGIEVSCLGFFLGFIYLRFGLIPVITAHFLFDIFWNSAGYLLGHTNAVYFTSAVILLLVPGACALIAFLMDRKVEERPLTWLLNAHQKYNLKILKEYLKNNWDHFGRLDKEQAKKEIASHHWDFAVVDVALDEVARERAGAKS